MLSSEDLERFYFQYQTEAVPLGMSVQTFCLRNNVPYNIFHKWYKDTRAVHRHRKPGKVPGALPVRISVELTLSNGLHILQKDLDYPGLYRLIQKLEVLC